MAEQQRYRYLHFGEPTQLGDEAYVLDSENNEFRWAPVAEFTDLGHVPVRRAITPAQSKTAQAQSATIQLPPGLHPDTVALVLRFSATLAAKLNKSQNKYGYGASWAEDDWKRKCANDLIDHLEKGDPLDVAAYCAFMWHHGWATSIETTTTVHA